MPSSFTLSRAVHGGRLTLAIALGMAAPWAAAQPDTRQFPQAAVRFLDVETPAMDQAVRTGDRTYFHDAMGRMVEFADTWGFKARANPALAPFAACTRAIEDQLVVGLCRLTPNGDDCTPQLASGFERNLRACRELAGR